MAQMAGPLLTSLLERYGLGSLTSWAAELIVQGVAEDELVLRLYDQGPFKQRFPAIEAREKAGLPPLSAEEYLQYESVAFQAAKANGISLTQNEINELLVNNVSIQETQERLSMAMQAVFQTDARTRDELSRLYGIGTGDLAKFWLDPKKELPILQRRFATAQISGEAIRTGYNTQLAQSQLEYLANRGVTGETASELFGSLVEAEELFEAVDETEQDIGVDDQLRLATGDVDQQKLVEQRAQKRVAPFQSGGGFSTGSTGVAGLGSANK